MRLTRTDRGTLLLCALLFAAAEGEARAQDATDEANVEDTVDAIFAPDAELPPADPAAERSAMARALFADGLTAARESRFVEAANFFERAQALRPAPGIAYNLASALAQVGRLVSASELLQWVIRHPETTGEMRLAAEATIGQITPRLATVHVVVSGPTEGVVLLLDGAPLQYAAVGVDVPLDPGPHRLEAMRDDAPIAERDVELVEGALERVEIEVPPLRAPRSVEAPLEEPTPAPPPAEDLAWLGWSGAALGVAIVIAVITAAVVMSQPSAPAEPIEGTTYPRFLEWD